MGKGGGGGKGKGVRQDPCLRPNQACHNGGAGTDQSEVAACDFGFFKASYPPPPTPDLNRGKSPLGT